jgi:hypothetical protein
MFLPIAELATICATPCTIPPELKMAITADDRPH